MYNPKSQDLDREYFPSYHTTRFQNEPEPNLAVVEHFIKVTQQHERDLTENRNIIVENLRYGEGRRVVDVFSDKNTPVHSPLLVFVHGGYWQMLDKSHSCSIVGPLVRQGIRVAVMDYNLCPAVSLEKLMAEFVRFLDWIFRYAELTQVMEITFVGHSAGAHLLSRILNSPEVVSPQRSQMCWALVFMCGVYDLRELYNLESVNPKNILDIDERKAESLSPMLWSYTDVGGWRSTRIYVLVAEHDSVTFIEQSRRFSEVLRNAGFQTSFKVFQKYDHFDIIEETAIDDSDISRYLRNIRNE
ncbi:kynurenine formamidase [Drosophila kikkawai]|uniref:Kynurenine formamidase n=1 Tax=Drosophila kikkawai TaxID=30033 RepID=A0A6P4IXL7_DROKI|nr:kynurenine formamidase [Drosophila kikkawai]XP_017033802.1 kynurenine formamidase [Drosophila kikkawai]XP_041631956.1 kynurenine formamidase [Drosophila kikkawai]